MFNCKIAQHRTAHLITISPMLRGHTYALYVFAKIKDAESFSKIKAYNYQPSNTFFFVSNDNHEELFFHYFSKNSKNEVVCNAKTNILAKGRQLATIKNLNFRASFDLDVINDYATPIKYQWVTSQKKHYIFFNGALPKDVRRYPTFNRHSWAQKLDSNILNIYDSSLNFDQDYRLGWYYGTHKKPLSADISSIIKCLKEQRSLQNHDLIFYGSSGGGWAALKYSSLFPGSLAVAINPQTEILKYQFETSVQKFLFHSYPNMERHHIEAISLTDLRIDPSSFIKAEHERKSKFIIAQNIVDEHHYLHHYLPFWKNFSQNPEGGWDIQKHNYSIVYDHPSGHSSETEEVFSRIQAVISGMKWNLAWFSALASSLCIDIFAELI